MQLFPVLHSKIKLSSAIMLFRHDLHKTKSALYALSAYRCFFYNVGGGGGRACSCIHSNSSLDIVLIDRSIFALECIGNNAAELHFRVVKNTDHILNILKCPVKLI